MSRVSVPAIYDGKEIRLLQAAPVRGPYHVLVTFLEPACEQEGAPTRVPARFWDSFGAWRDDRPIETTLHEIHRARRSKTEPPAL